MVNVIDVICLVMSLSEELLGMDASMRECCQRHEVYLTAESLPNPGMQMINISLLLKPRLCASRYILLP